MHFFWAILSLRRQFFLALVLLFVLTSSVVTQVGAQEEIDTSGFVIEGELVDSQAQPVPEAIVIARLPGESEPLVSMVTPSLIFEDLTLKQPSGEIPNPPVASHPFFERE